MGASPGNSSIAPSSMWFSPGSRRYSWKSSATLSRAPAQTSGLRSTAGNSSSTAYSRRRYFSRTSSSPSTTPAPELAKSLETRLEATNVKFDGSSGSSRMKVTNVVSVDDERFAAMIDLCSNLRAPRDAPTTAYQDRKQILRSLIKSVFQDHRDDERILLRIVWTVGTPDTTFEVKLGGYINRIMMEMLNAGDDFATIADKCNRRGILTARGREWTGHTVAHKLRSSEQRRCPGAPRR